VKQVRNDRTEARLELGDTGRLVGRNTDRVVDLTQRLTLVVGESRRPASGADHPAVGLDQPTLDGTGEDKVDQLHGRGELRAHLLERDARLEGARAVRVVDEPNEPRFERRRRLTRVRTAVRARNGFGASSSNTTSARSTVDVRHAPSVTRKLPRCTSATSMPARAIAVRWPGDAAST